jgi:hypothetical protein
MRNWAEVSMTRWVKAKLKKRITADGMMEV